MEALVLASFSLSLSYSQKSTSFLSLSLFPARSALVFVELDGSGDEATGQRSDPDPHELDRNDLSQRSGFLSPPDSRQCLCT